MGWKRLKTNVGPDLTDPSLVWAPLLVPESDGTIRDQSASGWDGATHNGVIYEDSPLGPAANLDAIKTASDFPYIEAQGNLSTAFTLSAWCKVNGAYGTYQTILTYREYQAYLYADYANQFTGGYNPNDVKAAGYQLNDNMWHHCACTRAADGSVNLYLDGVLVGSAGAAAIPAITANNYWRIGCYNGTLFPLKGSVVAPAVYDEVKDAAWVANEFNKGHQAADFKQVLDCLPGTYAAGAIIPGTPWRVGSGSMKVEHEVIRGKAGCVLTTVGSSYATLLGDGSLDGGAGPTESLLYGEVEFDTYWPGSGSYYVTFGGIIAGTGLKFPAFYMAHATTDAFVGVIGSGQAATFTGAAVWNEWTHWRIRSEKDLVSGIRMTLWKNGELLVPSAGSNPTVYTTSAVDTPTAVGFQCTGSAAKFRLDGFTKRSLWRVGI